MSCSYCGTELVWSRAIGWWIHTDIPAAVAEVGIHTPAPSDGI